MEEGLDYSYDWEDDAYVSPRRSESTTYTLQDLLGVVSVTDAGLKFNPGIIKVYDDAEWILAEDGESWRTLVLAHCRKEADLSEDDIYSEYDDVCVITYPHGGFTVVTMTPSYD